MKLYLIHGKAVPSKSVDDSTSWCCIKEPGIGENVVLAKLHIIILGENCKNASYFSFSTWRFSNTFPIID